jgi:hypothetical protein
LIPSNILSAVSVSNAGTLVLTYTLERRRRASRASMSRITDSGGTANGGNGWLGSARC